MKAWIGVRILDSKVTVYDAPRDTARAVFLLTDNPEVELTKAANGFVEIRTQDGHTGFIDGKTPIHRFKTMSIRQDQAIVYATPSTSSGVLATLSRDARVKSLGPPIDGEGTKWINVATEAGRIGYIRGDVSVLALNAPPRIERTARDGMRNIFIGGAIFLIGTIVTAGSYSAVSRTGGTYLVAWGAILFGGLQLVKGLSQMTGLTANLTRNH